MNYEKMLANLSDRSNDVLSEISEFVEMWGCDISKRKPRRFEGEDGETVTELDLATVMVTLVNEQATVTLPNYRRSLQRVQREGEVITSAENRKGVVVNVSSNQKVGSMGITFKDQNVLVGGEQGAYRTFNFVGADGKIRDESAWTVLEIEHDNGAITERLDLPNVVSPGRRNSVYGRPYAVAKCAISRLEDEQQHYNALVKELRNAAGVVTGSFDYEKTDDEVTVLVTGFAAEIDGFSLTGKYASVSDLAQAEQHVSRVRSTLKMLRFLTRMSEYAFLHHGIEPYAGDAVLWTNGGEGTGPTCPAWAVSDTWETGYKVPRGRTFWARIDTFLGLKLRFRAWQQKHKVSADEAIMIEQAAQSVAK